MTTGTGTADGLMIPVVLQVWNKYWIIVFDPNTLQTKNFVSLNTADGTFRPTGIALSNDGRMMEVLCISKCRTQ
ncbi:MAG: hypothetical protein ACJ71X_11350 [Nitrososphaeraceae archaeon]